MSEEFKQIYKMIKQCVDFKGTLKLNSICCNDILNYINELQQENNQLKERINKAIGHINACGCALSTDEARYLLEILKGGSNE